MNKDDLLRPRIKCIAPYPHSPFEVGEVLQLKPDLHFHEGDFVYEKDTTSYSLKFYFEKYPHLFKLLQWWEEREISELPEYVKVIETGEMEKVTRYFIDTQHPAYFTGKMYKRVWNKQKQTIEEPFNLAACLPSSVEEFNNFNEKKL